MARKRVVSRTFTTTIVTALVTDITEAKVAQEVIVLSGKVRNPEMLDKLTRKAVEKESTPHIKFNCVLEAHEEEALYSMPEEQFLMMAERVEKKTEAEA